MSTLNPKVSKGMVEAVLDDAISEEEMDRVLAAQHDHVEGMLKQGRDEMARGEVAPLESLHVFLQEARKRLKTTG